MICFGGKFKWEDRQKLRRKALGFVRDLTDMRLASIDAAISKLDEQIARDEFLKEKEEQ